MKRYIRASISDSTPDWLRRKLTGRFGNSFRNNLLKRYHVALDRATYTRDPDTYANTIPIYLLRDDYGTAVYVPGVNDDETVLIGGRNRKLGSIAKSKLPDMAEDMVYLTLSDENTFKKTDKYQDPRYTYRYNNKGDYAGQYMTQNYNRDTGEYEDAGWSTSGKTLSNESRARDKSGYKIPSPEERLTAYYQRYPEKIVNKVDDVYDRLVDAKSMLVDVDFKNTDIDMSKAYRYFSDALSDYNRLLDTLRERERFGADEYTTNYTIRNVSRISQDIKRILDDVAAILNGESRW